MQGRKMQNSKDTKCKLPIAPRCYARTQNAKQPERNGAKILSAHAAQLWQLQKRKSEKSHHADIANMCCAKISTREVMPEHHDQNCKRVKYKKAWPKNLQARSAKVLDTYVVLLCVV